MDPLERARQSAGTAWTEADWRQAQTFAIIAVAEELRAIRELLGPRTVERTA